MLAGSRRTAFHRDLHRASAAGLLEDAREVREPPRRVLRVAVHDHAARELVFPERRVRVEVEEVLPAAAAQWSVMTRSPQGRAGVISDDAPIAGQSWRDQR